MILEYVILANIWFTTLLIAYGYGKVRGWKKGFDDVSKATIQVLEERLGKK